MPDQPVISFQNVSKRFAFTKDEPQSLQEIFVSLSSRGPKKPKDKDLWAIRNISFEVMPGQCFGIVGRNGSGKSTILKLIARILRPNGGRMIVRGRVSPLLELGAGFHRDLTGRENIFLNAALLGLNEAATRARFGDIVAFSELEEFIDMPVKHYSSGMYMRLGFSVAIHMQPDILIVDEILTVGDQVFQTKCIDAIMDMKRRGVTIVVVSHNMNLIRTLCSDLLWIEKGEMQAKGPVADIADQYVEYSYHREGQQVMPGMIKRGGNSVVEITHVRFLNGKGEEQQTFKTGEQMTIEMTYMAHEPVSNPEFGLAIYRQDGLHINGPNTNLAGLDMGIVEGRGVVRYEIERLPLLPATYRVTTAVHDRRSGKCFDLHKEAYALRIIDGGTTELYGAVAMPANWSWESQEPSRTKQQIEV
jgi:lipopolysaccharide transport system ATP-binding protein